jgi:thiamine-monophosphate kinase
MLISELGEQGLLKLIEPYCLVGSIGDDGAILTVPNGERLVVTTDVLVDRVHFSDRTTTAFDVGWKSIAVNLSDLAAMGANPIGITVGLSLPPSTAVDWLEGLYRGMKACAERYGTGIVGGDLTRSAVVTVAVTAMGVVSVERTIARNTAKIGDAIVITGYHGRSAVGLELLLDPSSGDKLSAIQRQQAIDCHQRPQPRLDILPILNELDLDRAGIGGMDSSDGLADAIFQICRASNVGAQIDRSLIPICPIVDIFDRERSLHHTLYGGEDFELVLTLAPDLALQLVEKLGIGAAIIGRTIEDKSTVEVINSLGKSMLLNMQSGFQHFRSP